MFLKQITLLAILLFIVLLPIWIIRSEKQVDGLSDAFDSTPAAIKVELAQNMAMSFQTVRFAASPLATPMTQRTYVASPEQLPPIGQDLLFANEHGLLRWRHATNQLETVVALEATNQDWPPQIEDFQMSADGSKILVRRYQGRVDKLAHFDLLLYDRASQQVTTLLTTTTPFHGSAISPDGQWIAYILRDLPPVRRHFWLATGLNPLACYCGESPITGVVYALNTQAPRQPVELGRCGDGTAEREECHGLLGWSVDDTSLMWSDGAGLWAASYKANSGRLVVQHPDPMISLTLFGAPARRNHYIISQIYHSDMGYGVLDTQTWRMTKLPNTAIGTRYARSITWLQDGRLLLMQPAFVSGSHRPAIEIWSIDSEREPFLQLDQWLQLPVGATNYPGEPTQLADGRIVLALFNTEPTLPSERGLYLLNLNQAELQKINDLPPSTTNAFNGELEPAFPPLYWSPDGAGAILPEPALRNIWYLPADGSPPSNLNRLLGTHAETFIWLPNASP